MGAEELAGPIQSSKADDPTWTEAIDAFVLGLAEAIDHLQDAESQGRLREVARLAGELAEEAERVGYGALATAGRAAEGAARAEKLDETHTSLVMLTAITRRIRMGHRGSP